VALNKLAAMCISTLLCVLAICSVAAGQSVPEPQTLDDGRQWLDSRALPAATAPALLRAAAANARNQTAISERLLLRLVESQPGSDAARQAHELLSRIYLRSGQYGRVTTNLDEWARAFPDDPRLRSEKADVEQFRGLPDQINGRRRRFTLRHGPDFAAPLLINGQRSTYLLDTGAWISVMTIAEAKRLGLTIQAGGGVLGESSGKGVNVRMAVAKTLSVGPMIFHNVSFAILPDVEPWKSMPTGHGGIIGAPVLLQLGCLRWTKGGAWEVGCRNGISPADTTNMVFFGNHLLVSAKVSNRQSFMTLDTGAETTDLNANFAREFASEIQAAGRRDTTSVSGVGGTAVIDSISLPQLDFLIAGKSVTLHAANVTMQENAALGGRCCIGNIGLDLLLQTGALTIDFSNMILRIH
jgi:predicted aspartyl protease